MANQGITYIPATQKHPAVGNAWDEYGYDVAAGETASTIVDASFPPGHVARYGAVPQTTKAAATDCTEAIQTAFDSGESVQFERGWYGHTGDLQVTTVGQDVAGVGANDNGVTAGVGTGLYKLSGTGDSLEVNCTHVTLRGITFDGHNLAGSQLWLNGAKYSTFEKLGFYGQGGSDYALRASGAGVANVNDFYALNFGDTNYGHIQITNGLYQHFYHTTMGNTTGGYGLDLGLSGGQASGLRFYGLSIDNAGISIHDACDEIDFFGLSFDGDAGPSAPFLIVNGSSVHGVHVVGFKVQRGASAQPLVQVVSAKNVAIHGMYLRDTGSLAGQHVIELDGAQGFTLDDVDAYSNNAYVLVKCQTNRSSHVSVGNVRNHDGGAGSCVWMTDTLHCVNGNFTSTFITGHDNPSTFINCGAINTASSPAANRFTAIGTAFTDVSHQVTLGMDADGVVKLGALAGTGSRTVVADANGVLSAP